MAAADQYDGLVTAADIARKLGVSRQRGHELTSRASFPQPVAALPGKRLWREGDVDQWIREFRPPFNEHVADVLDLDR